MCKLKPSLQITPFILLFAVCLGMPQVFAQENGTALNEHLAVFQPMLGKTWKGEFANSTAENPVFDVSHWERILNGNGIRITHSVNDGMYGGESILMWDAKANKIAFWYFTTAGFHTEGAFDVDGKSWSSVEQVTGNENGITEVKSTTTLLDNGEMHVKAEYFANGNWTPGHEIHYKPAPDATVVFK
jgi:hypothetical protein